MNSDRERLKKLRQDLNLKQKDFAEKISTTQGHISDIENGRKNLSERTIKLICLEDWNGKTVNETWLRTGQGKMFKETPLRDEVGHYVEELLKDYKDNPFYDMIIDVMKTYAELDEKSKKIIRECAKKLRNNLSKTHVSLEEASVKENFVEESSLSDDDIDQAVADYRRQLELERQATGRSEALRKNA